MFMHHRWITKGFGKNELVVTVENAFRQASVRLDGSGDGWRLGDSGGALVLCQVMPINDQECHMITVGASENQQALGIVNTVSSFVEGTVHFD